MCVGFERKRTARLRCKRNNQASHKDDGGQTPARKRRKNDSTQETQPGQSISGSITGSSSDLENPPFINEN